MFKKNKILSTILSVILLILLVASFTYAWYIFKGSKNNVTGVSNCFNVLYTKGNDINGTIMPSLDYTGGLSTSVKINMDSSCDIEATGKIILNTDSTTSSNLLDKRNNKYPLHYQVIINNNDTSLKGDITSYEPIEIDIGTLNYVKSAIYEYTIYIWISQEDIINSDVGSVYNGSISASVSQIID